MCLNWRDYDIRYQFSGSSNDGEALVPVRQAAITLKQTRALEPRSWTGLLEALLHKSGGQMDWGGLLNSTNDLVAQVSHWVCRFLNPS